MQNECVEQSDAVLVVLTLLGRKEAFGFLVKKYQKAVYTIARQYAQGEENIDDIVQEVFFIAFNALNQLNNAGKFGSWLYAITKHHAISINRKKYMNEVPLDSGFVRNILADAKYLWKQQTVGF